MQGSCGFWNPGIIIILIPGPGNVLAIMQEVLEKFWKSKSKNSYEHIFSFGENTSHTLSAQGSFGLCYLAFKEDELIDEELNY